MMSISKFVRTRLFSFFLTLLSFGMLLVLVLHGYWLFRDYNVLEWKIEKYEMQKETYLVGEPLTYRTAFCKFGDYESVRVFTIVDGVSYLLPQQLSKADEGCYDFISSTIATPNLPSGKYHIESVIIYHVNPLRTVEYRMGSGEFYIENPNN